MKSTLPAALELCLSDQVEKGVFPGASYCVGTREEMIFGAVGRLGGEGSGPVTPDSLYDLASLTKVLATTTVVYSLVQAGKLRLEDPVGDWLDMPHLPGVTLRNLLLHDSGLPAYLPLQTECDVLSEIQRLEPVAAPGEVTQYSCLGFILLRYVVERAIDSSFFQAVSEVFTDRVGLSPGSWISPTPPPYRGNIAPASPKPNWRRSIELNRGFVTANEQHTWGYVHDPLAFLQQGISGNAGLFGSAKSVGEFCSRLLREDGLFGGDYLNWTMCQKSQSTRALGWDTKSPVDSSAGQMMPPDSFGHTGFAGTVIWISRTAGVFGVMLSNRIFAGEDQPGIHEARRSFFDTLMTNL